MDCTEPRPVLPPDRGAVVAFPEVGGLHHHCERVVAGEESFAGRVVCIFGIDTPISLSPVMVTLRMSPI